MNPKRLYLSAAIVLALFSGNLSAQVTTLKGRESKKAVVNFTELAAYCKLHPETVAAREPLDEEEDGEKKPSRRRPDPSMVHMIDRASRSAGSASYGPLVSSIPSPAPNDSFLSTLSPGSIIPPDTHGAVDSQYCVTTINSAVHIQNRTGGDVTGVSLNAFWSSVLPAGTGTTDPRAHYDPYNRRWIIITDILNFSTYEQSNVGIAVSKTSDPTGDWYMYLIPADPTNVTWLDFPCVGFNKKWVTFTGNMFGVSGGQAGANIYVVNYATMLAGTGAAFTEFQEPSSFTIAPAITFDTAEENQYAIEVNDGHSGNLKLWKISGPVGSPSLTVVGYPATTTHWQFSASRGADFCPQVSVAHKIQAGDDRITELVYRNHTLWCAHTVFLPASGTPTRSSIMWWQVDTSANPIQNGMIDDPATPTFFDYASISVNKNNDALIGYGYLSSYIHPSCAYSVHLHTDAADTMRAPFVFRHGRASYSASIGGSSTRWGDYSGTCIDPRNDEDFWTIQESSFVGTSPNWDTWWANFQICPKPAAPPIVVTPAAPCTGDTATYKIHRVPGATTYSWIVTGTGWTGSSTDTSITLTAGTGVATIGVLAYNSCGEGETNFFTITPASIPASPSIIATTPPCVGGPTPVFSATSVGATSYNWTVIGTGWTGTSGTSAFTPTSTSSDTATLICTASNACGSSLPDTMLVIPLVTPVTTFSITSHEIVTYANDLITFTGTAPSSSAYFWDFGGGAATPGTGAGPQTISWTIPGLKTITLTVDNGGCYTAYTDTILVDINLGVKVINNQEKGVAVQPNPNNGNFNIVFSQQVNGAVSLKMANMQGKIVFENKYQNISNNVIQVSTADVPPGTYTLSIYSNGLEVTKKVTVIK